MEKNGVLAHYFTDTKSFVGEGIGVIDSNLFYILNANTISFYDGTFKLVFLAHLKELFAGLFLEEEIVKNISISLVNDSDYKLTASKEGDKIVIQNGFYEVLLYTNLFSFFKLMINVKRAGIDGHNVLVVDDTAKLIQRNGAIDLQYGGDNLKGFDYDTMEISFSAHVFTCPSASLMDMDPMSMIGLKEPVIPDIPVNNFANDAPKIREYFSDNSNYKLAGAWGGKGGLYGADDNIYIGANGGKLIRNRPSAKNAYMELNSSIGARDISATQKTTNTPCYVRLKAPYCFDMLNATNSDKALIAALRDSTKNGMFLVPSGVEIEEIEEEEGGYKLLNALGLFYHTSFGTAVIFKNKV